VCELLALADLQTTDAIKAFLNAVVAKNKSAEARAWATFALGVAAYTEADDANDPMLFKEAEQLFAKVVKEVPADETEGTPVDAAERYLFELRNLLPGKKAPDFECTDLKGKPVKLSQLKGKVTLLVFWATWDQFSVALEPQLQELSKKYKGQPLNLVGISGDDDVETLSAYLKAHPLPWTQWFNGPEGGVLDEWNVQGFPTVYLIDATGVIRQRNVFDDKLNDAVEKLVKEAADAKKKPEKDPPKPPK
jgi:peroxiredoxin